MPEDKARDRVESSDSARERNAVFGPQGPDACLRAPHRQAARMDFFNGLRRMKLPCTKQADESPSHPLVLCTTFKTPGAAGTWRVGPSRRSPHSSPLKKPLCRRGSATQYLDCKDRTPVCVHSTGRQPGWAFSAGGQGRSPRPVFFMLTGVPSCTFMWHSGR